MPRKSGIRLGSRSSGLWPGLLTHLRCFGPRFQWGLSISQIIPGWQILGIPLLVLLLPQHSGIPGLWDLFPNDLPREDSWKSSSRQVCLGPLPPLNSANRGGGGAGSSYHLPMFVLLNSWNSIGIAGMGWEGPRVAAIKSRGNPAPAFQKKNKTNPKENPPGRSKPGLCWDIPGIFHLFFPPGSAFLSFQQSWMRFLCFPGIFPWGKSPNNSSPLPLSQQKFLTLIKLKSPLTKKSQKIPKGNLSKFQREIWDKVVKSPSLEFFKTQWMWHFGIWFSGNWVEGWNWCSWRAFPTFMIPWLAKT